MRQCDAFESFFTMRVFRGFGFQELAARGCVEIEVARFDRRPWSEPCRYRCCDRGPFSGDRPCVLVIRCAAGEREPCDRCDAGQSLASEAEAAHPLEIFERRDLARRMTGKGKRKVGPGDAAAIVGYLDETRAAGAELDGNVACSRVEAVFEKLLQSGCRPLDHFACGDLVYEQVRQ